MNKNLGLGPQSRQNNLSYHLPFGHISVQGLHILIPFSSTSILELGQARTQELESTTKLSGKKGKISKNVDVQQTSIKQDSLKFENDYHH